MCLTINIKREIEQPINIPVPSFWKCELGNYTAIVDEATVICFYKGENLTTVLNASPERLKDEIIMAHNTYDLCDEVEWMDKYNEVLKSISMAPVLTCENVQDKEAYQNLQNSITY